MPQLWAMLQIVDTQKHLYSTLTTGYSGTENALPFVAALAEVAPVFQLPAKCLNFALRFLYL
jgi:hypothetical protein